VRVEGRNTPTGYELAYGAVIQRTWTREAAHADAKLRAAIKRNRWQEVA